MDQKLNERERSVLHLFAKGLEAEAVAEQLGITSEQVEQTSLNILHKLFSSSLNHTLEASNAERTEELASV